MFSTTSPCPPSSRPSNFARDAVLPPFGLGRLAPSTMAISSTATPPSFRAGTLMQYHSGKSSSSGWRQPSDKSATTPPDPRPPRRDHDRPPLNVRESA